MRSPGHRFRTMTGHGRTAEPAVHAAGFCLLAGFLLSTTRTENEPLCCARVACARSTIALSPEHLGRDRGAKRATPQLAGLFFPIRTAVHLNLGRASADISLLGI